jgi:hypothetical protein
MLVVQCIKELRVLYLSLMMLMSWSFSTHCYRGLCSKHHHLIMLFCGQSQAFLMRRSYTLISGIKLIHPNSCSLIKLSFNSTNMLTQTLIPLRKHIVSRGTPTPTTKSNMFTWLFQTILTVIRGRVI